jgi:hypothetical protein
MVIWGFCWSFGRSLRSENIPLRLRQLRIQKGRPCSLIVPAFYLICLDWIRFCCVCLCRDRFDRIHRTPCALRVAVAGSQNQAFRADPEVHVPQ